MVTKGENMSDDNKDLLMQYRFRLSSEIDRVDKVKVKMTAGKLPDPNNPGQMMEFTGWVTVFQRTPPKEPPPGSMERDNWPGVYPKWKPGLEVEGEEPPGDLESLRHEGMITLRWDIAKAGGNRENEMNEIRVDGDFWGSKRTGEQLKDRIPFRPHFPSYAIDPLVESIYAATPFQEIIIEAEGGLEVTIRRVREKIYQITNVKYPDVA
jgi:hypothetical protein